MAKIVMVGPESAGKGGISTVIRNFIQYFPKEQQWQINYIVSWCERAKLFYAVRAWWQLFYCTHRQEVAIVHIHVSQDASFYRKAGLLKAIKKGTKVIFHLHAPHFDQFYAEASTKRKNTIRKVLNQVDLIVALSDEWAKYYQTLTTSEVKVITNAVFIPKENTYQKSATNIMTFGRICERKGSHDILTLARRIQERFPELKFHLYGDTDGTTAKIVQQMESLGCKNVELHGWTTNQAELLKECALHLLPSYHEGLPMAILETMAHGIPNLATDIGGVKQVVEDQVNGYLVQPGDIDQMEQALVDFFSEPEKRSQFSAHARAKIVDHFSIEEYHQAWQQVYAILMQ
ncbi:glycosyltransferase family 4 protein [Enterococcus sp. AZ109]|uniref:glycosyltransferase family 4 protein n=1 Tax=Enterococcus sp. AZ109 TaxID=2774634 RepID=UPI003F233322